jgi:hypothetical protein
MRAAANVGLVALAFIALLVVWKCAVCVDGKC